MQMRRWKFLRAGNAGRQEIPLRHLHHARGVLRRGHRGGGAHTGRGACGRACVVQGHSARPHHWAQQGRRKNRASHAILGVHIIGRQAAELVHYGLELVENEASLEHVLGSVINFPTLHRLYKYAACDVWVNRRARRRSDRHRELATMTYLLLLASTGAAELYVLRRLRFGWFVVAIVLAGTLVDVSYLAYTPLTERNYDAASHVLYIEEIAQHLRLPPVSIFCTACGHPPLYFALAALWSRVVSVGGVMPHELGLQWFSLFLSSGFVVFALLLLRSTIDREATFRLAAALVVFWPSSVLNSVRVHNDALASPLMLAAMYFTLQWDRDDRLGDFYLAVVTVALALLTKATGYAVAAMLVAIAALRLRSPERQWARPKRVRAKQLIATILVLASAALLAVSLRETMSPHTLCQRVLGRACDVPRDYFVSNHVTSYLYFDLRDFLGSTSSRNFPPKQDHFWNGLAKSSLFGVMPLGKDFNGAFYKHLAVLMSLLLLTMTALCAVVLAITRSVNWQKYRALFIASTSMLALLIAFRALVPTPFHEDFRHVFPLLVPFCLLYAKAVERLRRWSSPLYHGGLAVGMLMIASSVLFFVRLP